MLIIASLCTQIAIHYVSWNITLMQTFFSFNCNSQHSTSRQKYCNCIIRFNNTYGNCNVNSLSFFITHKRACNLLHIDIHTLVSCQFQENEIHTQSKCILPAPNPHIYSLRCTKNELKRWQVRSTLVILNVSCTDISCISALPFFFVIFCFI